MSRAILGACNSHFVTSDSSTLGIDAYLKVDIRCTWGSYCARVSAAATTAGGRIADREPGETYQVPVDVLAWIPSHLAFRTLDRLIWSYADNNTIPALGLTVFWLCGRCRDSPAVQWPQLKNRVTAAAARHFLRFAAVARCPSANE